MAETRPFKPADGHAAREFERAWCENCAGHKDGTGCWILLAASAYEPEDAEFPKAWTVGEDGPQCETFQPRVQPRRGPSAEIFSFGKIAEGRA